LNRSRPGLRARFQAIDLRWESATKSARTRLVAIELGTFRDDRHDAVAHTIDRLRAAGVEAPVLVGVAAFEDPRSLGADGWTGADGATALRSVEAAAGDASTAHVTRGASRGALRAAHRRGRAARFLILFQKVLRDGLITLFVGAIEHQDAPVLVVSTDARRNLQSSTITPELAARGRGP
jgi:hypothetical protein